MTDRTGQSAIQVLAVGTQRQLPSVFVSPPVKFNPGWGLITTAGPLSLTDTSTTPSNIISQITEIAALSTIKYFVVYFNWGALESSRDVYKFDVVDALLAQCQASGKRLVIGIYSSVFTASSIDTCIANGGFPAYLRDDYDNGPTASLGTGGALAADPPPGPRIDAKIWMTVVMDRLIALHQAFAARYDTHPWFEGVTTSESAIGQSHASYSHALYLTELKRLVTALEACWVHTNVFFSCNSAFGAASGIAQRVELLQHMAAHRMVLSGPDIAMLDFIEGGAGGNQFQRNYLGIEGGVDFRSSMACGFQVQSVNMGGNHTPTAAQMDPTTNLSSIHVVALSTFQSRWCALRRKTAGISDGGTTNDQFWDTAAAGYSLNAPTIKTFLTQSTSTIPLVTSAPPNYVNVVTGGT